MRGAGLPNPSLRICGPSPPRVAAVLTSIVPPMPQGPTLNDRPILIANATIAASIVACGLAVFTLFNLWLPRPATPDARRRGAVRLALAGGTIYLCATAATIVYFPWLEWALRDVPIFSRSNIPGLFTLLPFALAPFYLTPAAWLADLLSFSWPPRAAVVGRSAHRLQPGPRPARQLQQRCLKLPIGASHGYSWYLSGPCAQSSGSRGSGIARWCPGGEAHCREAILNDASFRRHDTASKIRVGRVERGNLGKGHQVEPVEPNAECECELLQCM